MPTSVVQKDIYSYARQLDSLIHVYNPKVKAFSIWSIKGQKKVKNYHIDLILVIHRGRCLAANAIFATIYQRSYQATYTNGLDMEVAEYIQ